MPYLPLGRDSVYLDPARIPLAPLERVDVVVLPAALRVYLVTARPQSTAPATEIGITTGFVGTAGYRVDIAVVGARFAWYAAVLSIVIGHVIAVCLADIRARQVFTDGGAATIVANFKN